MSAKVLLLTKELVIPALKSKNRISFPKIRPWADFRFAGHKAHGIRIFFHKFYRAYHKFSLKRRWQSEPRIFSINFIAKLPSHKTENQTPKRNVHMILDWTLHKEARRMFVVIPLNKIGDITY